MDTLTDDLIDQYTQDLAQEVDRLQVENQQLHEEKAAWQLEERELRRQLATRRSR